MTLEAALFAVTLGSIIGMTCIMMREYRLCRKYMMMGKFWSREYQRLSKYYLRKHKENIALSEKLSRFDRPRGSKGKFVKKGDA